MIETAAGVQLDMRSDIHALGILLDDLLTGSRQWFRMLDSVAV